MTNLSPAAQAVLCAYMDLSWTPDEEDNGKYYKFCHKAGMAAALRAAADQVVPDIGYEADCLDEPVESELQCIRNRFFAIAAELEGQ